MVSKFRKILKVFFFIAAALYPILVYYFLVIHKIPLRQFSLVVIAFAAFAFIAGTSRAGTSRRTSSFRNSLLLLGLGLLCLITNSVIILKFYPLFVNLLFLAAFGSTLFSPPTMIFRFAAMQDKSVHGSLGEKKVEAYCRKVTVVWCVFFVINGSIAAWTIFSGSDALWSLYNGGISYILIGILFTGEFLVRKMVQKGIPRAVPLSAVKNNSRPVSAVMCYEGSWNDTVYKTWGDFLEGTTKLRRRIGAVDSKKWLLYCDDCWYFLLALTALLQCKKEILLSANISSAYIAEIQQGKTPLLTDHVFSGGGSPVNTFHVPALLESQTDGSAGPANNAAELPVIIADETSIIMYTSGSTGKPKEVRQRLTEFENDNRFILSKWGDEFLKRKLSSTVNQHHIYGLLFSILLPFTAGVPFRRKRIEFPEELEKLIDTEYMLITVPAFLKRAVEMEKPGSLCLRNPWIFTSGGAVDPETARKTHEILGFWPLEVYGSTETSGIAWRQSVNGMEWTPFDNAQVNKNPDGCLVIRSPYIKDPAGFETADMAEILEDGRFLLKGRIDSVVKIEEKRISLPEIESRILQSWLVADVCAIALEDRRQYLAAAMVFNDKGKEKFLGLDKNEINKFWKEYLSHYFENTVIPKKWRYLEALPVDSQGKKKKEDIKLLFFDAKSAERGGFGSLGKETIVEQTEKSVILEICVPESSPYFNGHFDGFPVLPGVAQIELVTRFASRYFGTSVALSEIPRVKFTNLVRPNTVLLLKLEKKENSISFSISSREKNTVHSTGILKPESM